MTTADTTIFLFSSNIRRQYEQDVINVVAAPVGCVFRFRYDHKYVAPELRLKWRDNQLVRRSVVVVYSIQQPAAYHPAAYVPVRRGMITRSFEDGSILVIEFQLGSYAALQHPVNDEAAGGLVRSFSAELGSALSGHPGQDNEKLRFSAADGDEPLGLITAGDTEAHGFERLVEYLTSTVSFGDYVFWRIATVRRVGEAADLQADPQGRFRLISENTYEVTIGHYQLKLDTAGTAKLPTFAVTSDPALVEVISPKQFTIASRYDSIPIRIRVPPLPDTRETILSIQPSPDVKGPSADLRLLVGPTGSRRVATAAAGGLAALLLVVPDLAGDKASVLVRFLPHIVAAGLLGWMGWSAVPSRPK